MKLKHALIQLITLVSFGAPTGLFAQNTAFPYLGHLSEGEAPANGIYDFQFKVYNALSGGKEMAAELIHTGVGLTNGMFTVVLDFGPRVFTGDPRWIELGVRTNGAKSFNLLAPRQEVLPTPYAMVAGALSGPVPGSNLSGSYTNPVTISNTANVLAGNGAGLSGLNASALDTGTVPDARLAQTVARTNQVWLRAGNAGTSAGWDFLGTTDHQPIEFRVNGRRALLLQPNTNNGAPNVICGGWWNSVSTGVEGATIAGGQINLIWTNSFMSAIGGGSENRIGKDSGHGTIAGGKANIIEDASIESAIGGGSANRIKAEHSTIAGGKYNLISSYAYDSSIGGGSTNQIQYNAVQSTIAGGTGNTVNTNSWGGTISGGYFGLIGTNAGYATIGGGSLNTIADGASKTTIAGGDNNTIRRDAFGGTIGGGLANIVTGPLGIIPGGDHNRAAHNSFAAGHYAEANHQGSFVWADSTAGDVCATTSTNQFLIRASGGVGIGVTHPRAQLHVGHGWAAGQTALNGSANKIIVEDASDNGRAALIAMAGVSNDRVELQLEASHREQRAIIGTTSDHQLQFRVNNMEAMVINRSVFGFGVNVGIAQNNPTHELQVVNAYCDGNNWVNACDRNLKENFTSVDPQAVLAKVASLPIAQWNYKSSPTNQHLGPVAQDFRQAFGLGENGTSISTVDADGVALAAIQGLHQIVRQKESEIRELRQNLAKSKQSLAELKQSMAELKADVEKLTQAAIDRP